MHACVVSLKIHYAARGSQGAERVHPRKTNTHTHDIYIYVYISGTNVARWGQGAKRVHPRETTARQVP